MTSIRKPTRVAGVILLTLVLGGCDFITPVTTNPNAVPTASVEQLFTAAESGFGAVLDETLEGLAGGFESVLSRRNDLLTDQQALLNDRIDRLNVLLEAKRLRLEAQFVGLESSLAILQGQQGSLNMLALLASSMQF